jgi:tetratricopeptide (TPR) repeat protein
MTKIVLALIVSILILFGCSEAKAPSVYKKGVSILKSEMRNIEQIPLEKRTVSSDSNVVKGTVNYERRAEYLSRNKSNWLKMLAFFNDAHETINDEQWFDDIMFCRAYGYLNFAILDISNQHLSDSISAIEDFIEYDRNIVIEDWTKSQLKDVFWNKTSVFFSKSLDEKSNLKQFFYLSLATLWKNKMADSSKAIEYYKEASKIDPESMFGKQAYVQVEGLTRE